MRANIGGIDRVIRGVVGIGLIGWAVMGGPVWAFIGVIPLATAVVRICPAYLPFGFSTCSMEERRSA